ncbi:solute carrier family 25 member 40-like X2 [Biomphalaria glabrata]|nr:solute carrier family 25 member 40-like [Biomphalaria glabrata]
MRFLTTGDAVDKRPNNAIIISPTEQMLSSCTGALMTSLLMTPFDVVKIRLQSQAKPSNFTKGHCFVYCNGLMDHLCSCVNGLTHSSEWYKRPSHFNGTFDAMIKISRNEGITSLWSGLPPTLKSTSSHASTEPSSLANSPTTSSSKKTLLATGDSVLTAEVLHCLNLVEKHHSFNSSNSSSDLYKKMFPDSAIASGFSCSERKAAYMSMFGISPYLAELQRKAVLSEKDYVLLFDETLIGPLQSKQLDIHRALQIWPAVNVYLNKIKGDKSKEPTCKSYKNLVDFAADALLEAKAQIFLSIAQELQPFLTKYQTDSHMMPFIAEDLFTTIKSLLRILQAETLSKLKSPCDLIALDLKSKDIFLAYSKIEIGIASSKVLQKIKATDLQIMTLKNECRQFISSLVAKLLDKSPVMIRLVQKLSCLNPSLMASSSQLSASRFRDLLTILGDSGRISLNECDQIYNKFIKCLEALEENNVKPKFELFHPATERLDDFLYNNFKPLDAALWDVLRPLLLLSHGQGTVERGFSYNKEVMIENMHEETLVAQRRICDFLKVNGGVLDVAITKPLLTAAASGRQNYHQYLEKQKTKKAEMAKNLERKRHDDELSDLKAKRKKLMEEEKFLRSSADKYADKAEAKQNFKLLSKSNDMRHEAKVKSAELVVLERTIQSRLQELLDC